MRVAHALLCATAITALSFATVATGARAQSFGVQGGMSSPLMNGRAMMMQPPSPPNEIGGGSSRSESRSGSSRSAQNSSRGDNSSQDSRSAPRSAPGPRGGAAGSQGGQGQGQGSTQAPLAHHLVPTIPVMPRGAPAAWPAETLVMERTWSDNAARRPVLCVEPDRPILSQKASAAYGLRPYEITGAVDGEPERLGCTVVAGTQGFTEGVARNLGWPRADWRVAEDTRAPAPVGASVSDARTASDGLTPLSGTAGNIRVERQMENWWRLW